MSPTTRLAAVVDALRIPLDPGGDPSIRGIWWGDHLREVGWQLQLAQLLRSPIYRGEGVPRGDGRAVVLLPGFLAGDFTLGVLSGWLERIGYAPHGTGMRANVDCMDRALDRVEERVRELHESSGRRVALIGHSRGGHFAKALAHRRPDWISHVISMGAGLDEPLAVSSPIMAIVRGVSVVHRRNDPALPADLHDRRLHVPRVRRLPRPVSPRDPADVDLHADRRLPAAQLLRRALRTPRRGGRHARRTRVRAPRVRGDRGGGGGRGERERKKGG